MDLDDTYIAPEREPEPVDDRQDPRVPPSELDTLAYVADLKRREAVSLITHYFDVAGAIQDQDNRAEMRWLIENIIDAAVAQAKLEILKREAGDAPV